MYSWISGLGVRFADEQEVAAGREDRFAGGLAGVQIVAEIDRVEPGVLGAVSGQPALHCVGLAILLLGAVLRGDELWLQRHDLVVPRRYQCRTQHGMEVFGLAGVVVLALAAQPRRAVRAADLVGTEILGAIQGNRHMVAEPADGGQATGLLQFCQHRGKHRIQQRRVGGVSISRMWLSLGILLIPNRPSQFDRP